MRTYTTTTTGMLNKMDLGRFFIGSLISSATKFS